MTKNSGTTPPLGLMYLASFLRNRLSTDVKIVDLKFANHRGKHIENLVKSFKPQVVGISALTPEAWVAGETARTIKKMDGSIPVILGGPHASSFTEDALRDEHIDAAVIGEGEETFAELAELIRTEGNGWNRQSSLNGIKGVAYWREGKLFRTPNRPFITDLDSLPLPAWDLVDLRRYWQLPSMSTIGIRPYMTVFTSRGCPYSCTYCHSMFGKRFRARSPGNVVAEMEELNRRFGIGDFEIVDDIANLDKDRINGILEGLLQKNLRPTLNFPNGIRTDLLTKDTVDLLKQVGAGEISVAVESASPRIQQLIKKQLNLEETSKNIELLAKSRILTRGFFMLGFPSETEEEMRSTIDFACKSLLHLALFFTVNPFEGTELHNTYKKLTRLSKPFRTIDYEYFGSPFNCSEVPDKHFRWMYRNAYYRFYLKPSRIYRILRDRPYHADILTRAISLARNNSSFRRLREK